MLAKMVTHSWGDFWKEKRKGKERRDAASTDGFIIRHEGGEEKIELLSDLRPFFLHHAHKEEKKKEGGRGKGKQQLDFSTGTDLGRWKKGGGDDMRGISPPRIASPQPFAGEKRKGRKGGKGKKKERPSACNWAYNIPFWVEKKKKRETPGPDFLPGLLKKGKRKKKREKREALRPLPRGDSVRSCEKRGKGREGSTEHTCSPGGKKMGGTPGPHEFKEKRGGVLSPPSTSRQLDYTRETQTALSHGLTAS